MAMNADSDKPERIYELDWLNEYGSASHKPEGLVNFIERNNKDAHPYILTRTIARQGRMRGTEIMPHPWRFIVTGWAGAVVRTFYPTALCVFLDAGH